MPCDNNSIEIYIYISCQEFLSLISYKYDYFGSILTDSQDFFIRLSVYAFFDVHPKAHMRENVTQWT